MHIVRIVSLIQYKISYVFHMLLVFSYAIYVPTHGIKSAHRIQQKYIPCVIVSLDIRIGIFDAVIMPVLVCIPNIKKKKRRKNQRFEIRPPKKKLFRRDVCMRTADWGSGSMLHTDKTRAMHEVQETSVQFCPAFSSTITIVFVFVYYIYIYVSLRFVLFCVS